MACSFSQRGAGEEPLVALIGKLGVGDRDLAAERGQRLALAGVVRLASRCFDELVHRNVDAADKETGDARNLARIAALRDQMFEPAR